MLTLALALQLLAPPRLPLAVDPGVRLAASPRPSLLAVRLAAGAGVLAGQAASVGLAAGAEDVFGTGHLELLRPTFLAGLTFIAAELALAPVGAALGAHLAAPDLALGTLWGEAVHLRGLQGALLAAVELVAALAGSPALALAGVLALFGSDVLAFPLFLARASPDGASPNPVRPADTPPRADSDKPSTLLGFSF